jgi:histidinol-phosphate aminotransferase
VIDVLNRVRGPFNLSTAQLETAEAAVRDRDMSSAAAPRTRRMRDWLADALNEIGVPCDDSHGQFRPGPLRRCRRGRGLRRLPEGGRA